jgi:hypothetical protein
MSKQSKKIIHVNMHNIRHNTKHGTDRPVFTVKHKGKNTYAAKVIINGPSQVVYQPDKPLSCGARAWIETFAELELVNPMTYQEACDL